MSELSNTYSWRPWLKAARPVAHLMIALPLLWGQAMAFAITQQFHWPWFFICLWFGVLCQVFVLYLNDYADEALDQSNRTYLLSGGSRVIPEGQLTGKQLYRAALLCITLLLALSLIGVGADREWLPMIAVVAIVLGWSYSLPPLQASYRGWGELHQAVTCGGVLPLTGFYLQSGGLASLPWLSLMPLAMVFLASNVLTALPDLPSDRAGGKRSYPVRRGARRARTHTLILSGAACLLTLPLSNAVFSHLPTSLLISAPALIPVLFASRIQSAGFADLDTAENALSPQLRSELKRFMLAVMSSHTWLLLCWTVLLFWHGAQIT